MINRRRPRNGKFWHIPAPVDEIPGKELVLAYGVKIRASWQKAVASIIEVGRILLEAKQALTHGSFGSMIETQTPFSLRTADKLMAIARNPILSNRTHESVLPPSYSTLYLLSTIPDDDLNDAIANGSVHAGMERNDVTVLGSYRLGQVPEAIGLLLRVFVLYTPEDLVQRLPHLPFPLSLFEKYNHRMFESLSQAFADLAEAQDRFDNHRHGELAELEPATSHDLNGSIVPDPEVTE